MKILTLHLKKKYFEQIRDGQKTIEYRLCNPYWLKRIAHQTERFDEIHLKLGYPKRGDESRTLRRKWCGYYFDTITHEIFGQEQVKCICMRVGEKIEQK